MMGKPFIIKRRLARQRATALNRLQRTMASAIIIIGAERLALLCGHDEHSLAKMAAAEMPMPPLVQAIARLVTGCRRDALPQAIALISAESWRPIPGLPDYEASDQGNIRRVSMFRGERHYKLLKANIRDDGYLRVAVWIGGKRKNRHVHRLVCLAFHGEPPADRRYACHDDGNRIRNVEGNLYWGTAADNYADQVRHGTARLRRGVKAWKALAPKRPPIRRELSAAQAKKRRRGIMLKARATRRRNLAAAE
jgi:hypothetical protein